MLSKILCHHDVSYTVGKRVTMLTYVRKNHFPKPSPKTNAIYLVDPVYSQQFLPPLKASKEAISLLESKIFWPRMKYHRLWSQSPQKPQITVKSAMVMLVGNTHFSHAGVMADSCLQIQFLSVYIIVVCGIPSPAEIWNHISWDSYPTKVYRQHPP